MLLLLVCCVSSSSHTSISVDTTLSIEISDVLDHQGSGGAVYIDTAAITLLNCNFSQCTTLPYETDKVEYNGGGIYVNSAATVILVGCSFTSCSAAQGGAAWFKDAASNVFVNKTKFQQCVCTYGMAGAIGFASGFVEFEVHECSFVECKCEAYNESKTDCAIIYAISSGGACHITESHFSDTLTGNQVHMMMIAGASLMMSVCTFHQNYGAAKFDMSVLCSWENVTYQNNDPSSVTITGTQATVGLTHVVYENSGDLKVTTNELLSLEDVSMKGNLVIEGTCARSFKMCHFLGSTHQITCPVGVLATLEDVTFSECTTNCLLCQSELVTWGTILFDNCESATSLCEIKVADAASIVLVCNLSFVNCRAVAQASAQSNTATLLKFTEMQLEAIMVTACQFVGCTSEGNGGGFSVLTADVSSFILGNTTFDGCTSRGHGGGFHTTVERIYVIDCLFKQNKANNGAGMYAKHAVSLVIMESSFYDGISASKTGSVSLEYSNSESAWIVNCTFAFRCTDSISSVVFTDGSIDCVTLFSGCEFTCIDGLKQPDRTGIHLWSNGTGICRFQLPMSFDATKSQSMYFFHGQDPAGSLDIFADDPDSSSSVAPIPTKTKYPRTPVLTLPSNEALSVAELAGVWITIIILAGFVVGVVLFTYWRNWHIYRD